MKKNIKVYRHYNRTGDEKDLIARTGQVVEVLRKLNNRECDKEVGKMYKIKFSDGFIADSFSDELHDK